jgi:hypothetical protein
MAVQLSSFTKAEYRDRVRGDLGLRSNALLTDAEIDGWGHESQREVARITGWLRKTGTGIDVTAGTAEYDVPVDALAIEDVRYLGRTLQRVSIRDLRRNDPDWRDIEGTPTHWYLRGMTAIGLHPNPTATDAGALVPHYTYFPAVPATDSDFYTVPTVLDRVLISYGKMMASQKDSIGEGRDRVALYRAEWEQGLREIAALVGEAAEGNLTVLGANSDVEEDGGYYDPLWHTTVV